jgi:paraquat-inducible protein B
VSKQANPTVIGAFIFGALLLMILIVIILSGDLFRKKERFVMYFEGSVKGLNVGATVDFKGVKIGEVVDISVVADSKKNRYTIPVLAEFDAHSIRQISNNAELYDPELDELIDIGLRAQLSLQSLLTGQLFVQLDFDPDEKPVFRGDGSVPEIPTIPTPLEKIEKSLEDFDLKQVLNDISSTMQGIQALINSPELISAISNLDKALSSFNSLSQNINRNATPVLSNLNSTLIAAQKTLRELTIAADHAGGALAEDSELIDTLQDTLDNIARAAQSVQNLADMLERNPESLLKGKPTGGR